jgi:hypothetical protein
MKQLLFLSLVLIATGCSKEEKNVQPAPGPNGSNAEQFKVQSFDVTTKIENYDIAATVNWSATREDQIAAYNVQRKMETESTWITVKNLTPTNTKELISHSYIDKFRRTNYDESCMYRLKIVDKGDGVSYSDTLTVSLKN